MGVLEKVGEKAIEHLPEILTITACGSVGLGQYLMYRATKKEMKDGDKKHYILPLAVSGAGIACIIASNRVSNAQKVSLAAVASALTAKNMSQRQMLKDKGATDEELAKLDKIDKYAQGAPSGKTLYYLPYLPDYGIKFWSTKSMIDKAEQHANKFMQSDGFVGLDDILEFLKATPPKNLLAREDADLIRNIYYAWDWDSDDLQGLVFEQLPTKLCGVDCVRLKIKQFGGRYTTFQ